jgi:hypothetical protein
MTSPDFVPSTIKEAVEHLVAHLEPHEVEFIQTAPPSAAHFGGGMALRNDWSLWEKETPLKRDAVENYKIAHADDLSGLILAWTWSIVRKESFSPLAYCTRFHNHWNAMGTTSLQAGGYSDEGRPL